MLDIAWPELVVIGVVALVAIGPKDLPKVMHAMGKWAGKARDFTQDMRRAFEQASFESEMTEKPKPPVPPVTLPPVTPPPVVPAPEGEHDKS